MNKLILCFFMLIALTGIGIADPITFEATVNSPRVSLDEVLQLTLTFTGVNQNLDPISLPTLDGFSAKYLGPSTSVSIVNGDYHSEKSFIYNLFPSKIGRFQIPPISATISGQTYTTKPIDVEVFESPAQAQASNGTAGQDQTPTADSLKDRILIMVSVDKTDVYLNEQIPLTIKLLVNGVPIRDIQYPQFDKTGFTVDEFEKPEQDSQVYNSIRYDVVVFKTNIYPDHLGDLPLGPVQIQGNVVYKTSQNNPFGQENNIFGAEIFNNFFDSYATSPMTATSQPIHLHVSPLPSENRPGDFSGAIGQSFDFQASVSPLTVKAGDPMTLKMSLTGRGNLKNLQMPDFKAPGFKSYEPQIKNTGDEKTDEEVIIPTATGIKEVPALHFTYFDTSIKDYKTITQGPFAIQVMAPSPDQDFKAIGFSNIGPGIPTLPANKFSFGKMINKIRKIIMKLFGSIWFWVSSGFILAAGIFYFLWRRFQDRLENDPVFARRFKAVREARQALVPAAGYITAGKPKDFYALLSKVLRDYLANKSNLPSATLSMDVIINQLKTTKLDEGHITLLKNILEQSDLVCFAGAYRDAAQMKTDLSSAQNLIAHFEKAL
jgi:hypothetical protein